MATPAPRDGGTPRVCPKTGKTIRNVGRSGRPGLVASIVGFSALVWFLIRVVPKPSRAVYPCQRAALPLATSFVLWVAGLTATALAFHRFRRQARYALAGLCVAAGVAVAWWTLALPGDPVSAAWVPAEPPNAPVGAGKGIHPGRVVWVHDPDSTSWDGRSLYWWSDANTDQAAVDRMLSVSVRRLAGEATDAAAWEALFRHFNRTHGRGDQGYEPGERIAIKINMNVAGDYSLTNEPIVSPHALRALLWQLVHQGGVTESAISVYDASRCINSAVYTPCHRDFPAVQFFDRDGGGDPLQVTRDDSVAVHYADSRVGSSGATRLPACVTSASYLINLALLRGHSLAGVTLCAKNHFGSVWRPGGGFSPSNIHDSIDKFDNAPGTVNSLVDLMGHEHLDGKALIFMIDALYGAVNQGSAAPSRWRSSPFDDDWTSSFFLSQDGVAIDSVALDFCRSEPNLDGQVTGQGVDNYLHEAALAHDPPSGAFYDPEGDGTRLGSLGVHEHWNNALDKQYSVNLGAGEGIELVAVSGAGGGFRRGDVNADRSVDISDPIGTLFYLFGGAPTPECVAAADAEDSGSVDITDAVYLLMYLFTGGAAPPAPFLSCGDDPTPDGLSCDYFAPCARSVAVPLVNDESAARILIPADGALGLTWIEPGADDSGWISGTAAVGYDDNPDYGPHFTTDLADVMRGVNTSAYIRIRFSATDPANFERLTLWVKYDDGFTAYLNGTEIARQNAPPSLDWDSEASAQHSDSLAVVFEAFDLTGHLDLIEPGDNLLAIHGLNAGLNSSDFLIAVELDSRVR